MEAEAPWAVPCRCCISPWPLPELSVRQDRAAPGRPRHSSDYRVVSPAKCRKKKKNKNTHPFPINCNKKREAFEKVGWLVSVICSFLGTDFHRGDWSRSRKKLVMDCLYRLWNSIWHLLLICQIRACRVCQMQLLMNFLKRNLMLT